MQPVTRGAHSRHDAAAIVYTVIVVAGLGLGLALACMPVETSLSHFLIDDMFYYLTTARNVLAGMGASLDGIHATNGFHPLWMLMLAGITFLTGGAPFLTVHLALGLALFFHWLSIGLLVVSVHRFLGSLPALAVAALLTFNYRLSSIPLGGLETALAGAMVMLVTVFYAFGRPLETTRGAVRLGLLLGFTFLARFDTLLFGLILLAFAAFSGGNGTEARRRLVMTSIAGTVALAVCLPWFAFSLRMTGELLPASGEAIAAWGGDPWRSVSSPLQAVKTLLSLLNPAANDLCNVFGLSPWVLRKGPASRVAAPVMGIVATALMAIAWGQRRSPAVRRLAWVPVYAGLHVSYYVWFGHALFRYFYPLLFPVLVFAAAVVSSTVRPQAATPLWGRRALVVMPLLLITVSALSGLEAFRLGVADGPFHGLHLALYEAATWISRQTPPDSVIGSFNAGTISYFSKRRTVNLDGAMNYSVIPAIRGRCIADYIRANGITHLADVESQLDTIMDDFSGEAEWPRTYQEVFAIDGTFHGDRRLRIVVLRRENPLAP
jgi:hypothetical protein